MSFIGEFGSGTPGAYPYSNIIGSNLVNLNPELEFIYPAPKKSMTATLREFGLVNTISVGGPYTVYKTQEAPGDYDAIQLTIHGAANITDPISASFAASASYNNGYAPLTTAGAAAAFIPVTWGTTDPRSPFNPGGGAANTLVSNSTGTTAAQNLNEGNVVSDIISVQSLPRTDILGRNPIGMLRIYGITVPDINGVAEANTASSNPWNAVIPGYYCGFTTGDQTAVSPGPQPGQGSVPSVSITYFLRGKAMYCLGIFGDSIDQGWLAGGAVPQTDGLINGWGRQLCSLLTAAGRPTACFLGAYQGNRSYMFHSRAYNALLNRQLTHCIIKTWSVNEFAQGIASVYAGQARTEVIVQMCLDRGVVPIVVEQWAGQYGNAAFKLVQDDWIAKMRAAGIIVFSARSVTDDNSTSPPQLKDVYCSVTAAGAIVDRTHPIKQGQADIAAKAFNDLSFLFP